MADIVVHVASKDATSCRDVERYVSQAITVKDDEKIPMVFAINKVDLSNDFPMEYIYKAVESSGATNYSIVKTSAKTGEGVTELFDEVARRASVGNINIIECIKTILSTDTPSTRTNKKKKCLVM